MTIVGCDLHARQQTIAMVNVETGELMEKTLPHEGSALRAFYAALEGPVVVGIEATGGNAMDLTCSFPRDFNLASFQIVGGTYRRACCCTDRTSWRPTNQAPHGGSFQRRPTDNLRVLQLRSMPDIVPVMNVVMHPAMMDAVVLNRA
jgi:hypothetical protein